MMDELLNRFYKKQHQFELIKRILKTILFWYVLLAILIIIGLVAYGFLMTKLETVLVKPFVQLTGGFIISGLLFGLITLWVDPDKMLYKWGAKHVSDHQRASLLDYYVSQQKFGFELQTKLNQQSDLAQSNPQAIDDQWVRARNRYLNKQKTIKNELVDIEVMAQYLQLDTHDYQLNLMQGE